MRLPVQLLHDLRTYWVIPLVITWKLALIGLFNLPVPANDAFFFDGAVVNWIHHGAYVNPSIARMFPTSATEFFSAYPPGYQAVLAGWMSIFGPSVDASQWLHGTLFSLHALIVFAFLRRYSVPPRAAAIGSLFLFAITFHDRPDSLAHVLGLWAYLCWTRENRGRAATAGAVLLVVLTLCTSLHIGAMYAAMHWGHAALQSNRRGWPLPAMLAMLLLPVALAAAVVFAAPTAWQGFQENLLVTPSYTGLRLPALDEVLKVGRNAPGLILIALGLTLAALAGRALFRPDPAAAGAVEVAVPLTAAALFAVAANLFIVHPNYIMVAMYPQPLAVAFWLWLRPRQEEVPVVQRRLLAVGLAAGLALASLRALALSTWGVVAASDVSRAEAGAIVTRLVQELPADAQVVVSSAYLYDLAAQSRVTEFHSDWISRYGAGAGALQPGWFILTPFDYHRRYAQELEVLRQDDHIRTIEVTRHARLPLPDESRLLQRVVQHLSWAPVVVRVDWL